MNREKSKRMDYVKHKSEKKTKTLFYNIIALTQNYINGVRPKTFG